MKLSRWKVAGFVLLIWSLIALPVIGPSWIYPKLFPPDPIPDSVQRAESLWWDSRFRADSMLQDSSDRKSQTHEFLIAVDTRPFIVPTSPSAVPSHVPCEIVRLSS
jgi:hypothetical protein